MSNKNILNLKKIKFVEVTIRMSSGVRYQVWLSSCFLTDVKADSWHETSKIEERIKKKGVHPYYARAKTPKSRRNQTVRNDKVAMKSAAPTVTIRKNYYNVKKKKVVTRAASAYTQEKKSREMYQNVNLELTSGWWDSRWVSYSSHLLAFPQVLQGAWVQGASRKEARPC